MELEGKNWKTYIKTYKNIYINIYENIYKNMILIIEKWGGEMNGKEINISTNLQKLGGKTKKLGDNGWTWREV